MRRGSAPAFAWTAVVVAICVVEMVAGSPADPGRASVPPPTPVPPVGSPSPFPTVLATPPPSTIPPSISARSAILEDLDTGQVLFGKRAEERRPVASLTKVMTALVVLEGTSLSDVVTVSAHAAAASGSVLGLAAGERISVRLLLYALLMQSSNDAAVALAEHVAGSESGFVRRMNQRARALGLHDTRFESASGLDNGGHSTARDLAALTRRAYQQPLFAAIVSTRFRDIPSPSGPPRRIQNRNILLWLYPGAIGVKTGFTTQAQHCVLAAARQEGRGLLAVALGAPGDSAAGAFDDSAELLNYGFLAFRRATLITEGQSVGGVVVEGVTVEGIAATSFATLVRLDQLSSVEHRFEPDPELRLPIAAGEPVGTEVLSVAGAVLGSVPVVAARSARAVPLPPRPPVEPSPLQAALVLLAALLRTLIGAFL